MAGEEGIWRRSEVSVNHNGFHQLATLFTWRGRGAGTERWLCRHTAELLMFQEPCGGLFQLQVPEIFLCFIRAAESASQFRKLKFLGAWSPGKGPSSGPDFLYLFPW